MRPSLLSIAAAFILLGLLGGCGQRPQPPQERPAVLQQDQWAPLLEARTTAWRSYQAQLNIKGESPKGRFSLRATVLVDLPHRCRIEAINPFGQTVSVLVVDRPRQQSSLFVAPDSVVYTAPDPETLVTHFLGVPLPLDVFGYSLLACVPPRNIETLVLTAEGAAWTGRSQDTERGSLFTYGLEDSPPALKSIRVRQDARDYSIVYEPPAELAVEKAPLKIAFQSSLWRMEVTVNQARRTSEIQDSAFTDQFPPTARRVELDHSP